MPLLKIETTVELEENERADLLQSLSKNVADILGKPEQYVMITISPAAILMSGSGGPAAFADLRSIGGVSGESNGRLTQKICQALQESLGIPSNRVYITFTDVPASNWGWNGDTFG
jgi:phenylpyruvate tautomerase